MNSIVVRFVAMLMMIFVANETVALIPSTAACHRLRGDTYLDKKHQRHERMTFLSSASSISRGGGDGDRICLNDRIDASNKRLEERIMIAQSVFNVTANAMHNDKPIFLFDGVCQFCNFGVHFCIDHDPEFRLRYASLQSEIGAALLASNQKDPTDKSSLVLVTSVDTADDKSDAVLEIIQLLDGLPRPLRYFGRFCRVAIPKPVRDTIYNIIAKNRHRIGPLLPEESCRIDLDIDRFVPDP